MSADERRPDGAQPDPNEWTCPDCGKVLDQSDKSTHDEKCDGRPSRNASTARKDGSQ